MDKQAASGNKDGLIIRQLAFGQNRKCLKIIYYFLRADRYPTCEVVITGKAANLGNGNGMQVLYR